MEALVRKLLEPCASKAVAYEWLTKRQVNYDVSTDSLDRSFAVLVLGDNDLAKREVDQLLVPQYEDEHCVLGTSFGETSGYPLGIPWKSEATWRMFALDLRNGRQIRTTMYKNNKKCSVMEVQHKKDVWLISLTMFANEPRHGGPTQILFSHDVTMSVRDCEFCSLRGTICECCQSIRWRALQRDGIGQSMCFTSWQQYLEHCVNFTRAAINVKSTSLIPSQNEHFKMLNMHVVSGMNYLERFDTPSQSNKSTSEDVDEGSCATMYP